MVWLDGMDNRILQLTAAETAVDAFNGLFEAMQLVAPRGVVLLVRQGHYKGWRSFGYAPEVTQRFSSVHEPIEPGTWCASLAHAPDRTFRARPIEDNTFDVGQRPTHEAGGLAIRLAGQPIAILFVERQHEETHWHPNVLPTLVTVAELRLELVLARKKLRQRIETQPTATAASPPKASTIATPAAPQPFEVPIESATEVQLAEPVSDPEDPDLDVARRFARLVATDIRLYNEDEVLAGRRNGDLAQRLDEPLKRGLESFVHRHAKLGDVGMRVFHEALVDVLAAGDTKLLPRSVLTQD